MKVSIITAVYNNEITIKDALDSISIQDYNNVIKVIVDGASTDNTLPILERSLNSSDVMVSEPDGGIYDALNKGISLSTGDIVGFLHSDDLLANESTITKVVEVFEDNDIDVVYGDLVYVNKDDTDKVIRYWKANDFNLDKLKRGWMPPHPTLYLRRSVYEKIGNFNTQYRIAADYDFMLRVLSDRELKIHYIPEVLVKMRVGGASNRSLKSILLKSREDYIALKSNKVGGIYSLLLKNISKIPQFFLKQ